MSSSPQVTNVLKQSAGWAAVAACTLYGGFAVSEAVSQILVLSGLTHEGRLRAAPPLFVVHTLSGALALVAAAVQLRIAGRLLLHNPRAHRALGRTYVGAAWVTSLTGLATAARFDAGLAGRVFFAIWAVSWFAATVVAVRHIRAGRTRLHRTWMIRSVALALVFATFSLVHPAVAALASSRSIVYPVALLISGALNIALAERWLRTHHRSSAPEAPAAVPTGRTAPATAT